MTHLSTESPLRRSWERLRIRLSAKYLDWAEALPRFRGGPVAQLQQLREFQRESSKKVYDQTRPPKDITLAFDSIILFDVFMVEDFKELEQSLNNLFPDRDRSRSTLRDFRSFAYEMGNFGTSFFGNLVPQKPFLSPFASKVIPDLPSTVQSIGVRLHKVLPSMLVSSLSIRLTAEFTQRIQQIQCRKHLSEIDFRSIFPFLGRYGWSMGSPDAVLMRTILSESEGVRSRVEEVLGSQLSGLFMRDSRSIPRLPVMEVMRLKGAPGTEPEFRTWLRSDSVRGWLGTFGWSPIDWYMYKRDAQIFLSSNEFNSLPVPDRLVFLTTSGALDERSDIHLWDFFNEFAPYFAFTECLSRTTRSVEQLRARIYPRLARATYFGFRKDLKLYAALLRDQLNLSRLKVEFEQSREFLKHWCGGLKGFHGFSEELKDRSNLLDELDSSTADRLSSLNKYVEIVSASFMSHIQVRNLDLSFKIQRAMLLWTVVVTLATILALIGSWTSVTSGFRQLVNWILN